MESMRETERIKKIYLVVLFLMLSILLWYFVLLPFIQYESKLQEDIKKLRTKSGELENQMIEAYHTKEKLKKIKKEMLIMDEVFPDDFPQEKVLEILNRIEEQSKIRFSRIQIYPIQELNQLNETMPQGTNVKENQSPNLEKIPNIEGREEAEILNIQIDFTGTVEQCKELLRCIGTYPYITISDVSFYQQNMIKQVQGSGLLSFILITEGG